MKKKTTRKKRSRVTRTPKQIAATKKLVALNKRRAKVKYSMTKATKTAKRKNPTPKHSNWVVATYSPTGKKVVYHDGVSWATQKSSAAIWHKRGKAQNFAKRCGRRCVVTDITTSPNAIKAVITGKV